MDIKLSAVIRYVESERLNAESKLVKYMAIHVVAISPSHPQLSPRFAISVGEDSPKALKLAYRLVNAIDAGKAIIPTGTARDANGDEYITSRSFVSGRTLNADLKRLGF